MGIFLGEWKTKEDVANSFTYYGEEESPLYDEIVKSNILFAKYLYEEYEGLAWVLFERDGKLYEVHGSHCSCYGLEGQWEEEETIIRDLRYRLEHGNIFNSFSKELKEFLDKYERRNKNWKKQ